MLTCPTLAELQFKTNRNDMNATILGNFVRKRDSFQASNAPCKKPLADDSSEDDSSSEDEIVEDKPIIPIFP